MSFDKYIDKVLEHEGGYVNDATDLGGETKYGITKRFYPHLDIKNLTKEQAKEIYYRDYWLKNHCDKLPENIQYLHFDTAINMGSKRAAIFLQKSIGTVKVDGRIGNKTLSEAFRSDLKRYIQERVYYYTSICKSRPEQLKFINGWLNRVIDIIFETL